MICIQAAYPTIAVLVAQCVAWVRFVLLDPDDIKHHTQAL